MVVVVVGGVGVVVVVVTFWSEPNEDVSGGTGGGGDEATEEAVEEEAACIKGEEDSSFIVLYFSSRCSARSSRLEGDLCEGVVFVVALVEEEIKMSLSVEEMMDEESVELVGEEVKDVERGECCVGLVSSVVVLLIAGCINDCRVAIWFWGKRGLCETKLTKMDFNGFRSCPEKNIR